MKRIVMMATLAAATVLSACGDKVQDVSRAKDVPFSFGDYGSVHSGATSTRSSVDLLSMN